MVVSRKQVFDKTQSTAPLRSGFQADKSPFSPVDEMANPKWIPTKPQTRGEQYPENKSAKSASVESERAHSLASRPLYRFGRNRSMVCCL
jgi:hypothetical protein